MIGPLLSRMIILLYGVLYPAYASYKALHTKNFNEYVTWMMYWIVYALFTVVETFTDILLFWFPFYYEMKLITVLWMLSPVTNGSGIIYRNVVHPMFIHKEPEINGFIDQAKEFCLYLFVQFGAKSITYATYLLQFAIKAVQYAVARGNIHRGTPVFTAPASDNANYSPRGLVAEPIFEEDDYMDDNNNDGEPWVEPNYDFVSMTQKEESAYAAENQWIGIDYSLNENIDNIVGNQGTKVDYSLNANKSVRFGEVSEDDDKLNLRITEPMETNSTTSETIKKPIIKPRPAANRSRARLRSVKSMLNDADGK